MQIYSIDVVMIVVTELGDNFGQRNEIAADSCCRQAKYDDNGNMTIEVDSSSYTYDAQNRLLTATKGSSTETFTYDGLNRQVSRKIGSASPVYNVYDGWDLIAEYAPGATSPSAAYLSGAGGLVKNLTTGRYYYQDASGSTSHLANSAGNLLEWYRYDLQGTPFVNGNSTNHTSAFGVRHLFTGQQWYKDIGLYDLRNRFYSPDIGRFLQADPIGFNGDATNLYRYSGNNPLKWSDPTGLIGPGTNPLVNSGGGPGGYPTDDNITDYPEQIVTGEIPFYDGPPEQAFSDPSVFTSPRNGDLPELLGLLNNEHPDFHIGDRLPPSPPLPRNVPPPLPPPPFSQPNQTPFTPGPPPPVNNALPTNMYQQFTVNVGPVAGISVSVIVLPNGQTMVSVGPQIGRSLTLISVSGTQNVVFGMGAASQQQIAQAIHGGSVTVAGGAIIGLQATWNSLQWTPFSAGGGFAVPAQGGISAGYTFKGPSIAWPPDG